MRLLNIRYVFALIGLMMSLQPVFAQTNADDTTRFAVMETLGTTRYHERLIKRQQQWNKLIPNVFMLQYAGDIGMLSAGIGWDYGRINQWETQIAFGYLPRHKRYNHYWTFTVREVYMPWRINLGKGWKMRPLSVSLAVNSILHHDFWTSEPDRYPSGYYGFSSRVRFQLGVGQRLSWIIPENHRFLSRKISLYYEIVTCDLYIRQKFLNKSIPLRDIIGVGVGVVYTI